MREHGHRESVNQLTLWCYRWRQNQIYLKKESQSKPSMKSERSLTVIQVAIPAVKGLMQAELISFSSKTEKSREWIQDPCRLRRFTTKKLRTDMMNSKSLRFCRPWKQKESILSCTPLWHFAASLFWWSRFFMNWSILTAKILQKRSTAAGFYLPASSVQRSSIWVWLTRCTKRSIWWSTAWTTLTCLSRATSPFWFQLSR